MSYTLICGGVVIGVLETPRNVRKALAKFSPAVGIKIRENYRIKRGHQIAGGVLPGALTRSNEARRKPVRMLKPGEFSL